MKFFHIGELKGKIVLLSLAALLYMDGFVIYEQWARRAYHER